MTADLSDVGFDPTAASVLRAVYTSSGDGGATTLPDLTRQGWSSSTVTRSLATLRDAGLVEDTDPSPAKGRPATTIRPTARLVNIGIAVIGRDNEPSKLVGTVTDVAGRERIDEHTVQVTLQVAQRSEPSRLIAAIAALARELIEELDGRHHVLGVGINIGGYVRDGVLLWFPGLDIGPLNLQAELRAQLELPVRVDNDATALAVHVALHPHEPAGKPPTTVAVIAVLPDGIGGALIVNGHVHRGARGISMEPGHVAVPVDVVEGLEPAKCRCRAVGCVEAYASPSQMRAALAQEQSTTRRATGLGTSGAMFAGDLDAAANEPSDGDQRVTAIFRRAGQALGRGIGSVVNIVNPDQLLVFVPPTFAKPARGSSAEIWTHALSSAIAESAPGLSDENDTHGLTLIPLDDAALESRLAVAAASLVTEALLNQVCRKPVAGHDQFDLNWLRPVPSV